MRLVVSPPQPGDSPCASCKVLYGATCCEKKTDQGPLFPMTYAEAKRIQRWTRAPSIEDAAEFRQVSPEEQQALKAAAGGISELVVKGVGVYLPKQDNGDCVYLAHDGCTIPNAKPHICALFPFSPGITGWKTGDLVEGTGFCFGQDVATSYLDAMGLFGVSTTSLSRIEQQWIKDRKSHAANMQKWRER